MPPKKAKEFTLTKTYDSEASRVVLEAARTLQGVGSVLTAYLKKTVVGGGITLGQVLQVSIYGQLEAFRVLQVDSSLEAQLEGLSLDRPPVFLVTPK
jgi:hypothetical protein